MLNVGDLDKIFQERFQEAVDEWLIENKQADGSDFSKLDLSSKLQEFCGYSRSCLYRWIEGNGVPSLQNLLLTANFFNKDAAYFIDRDWGMVRVHHVMGREKSFLIDSQLLGKRANSRLFFLTANKPIAELGVQKSDKLIIESSGKVVRDGFYLMDGHDDATKGIRYVEQAGKGKVSLKPVKTAGEKSDAETLSLKNISLVGMVILICRKI